MNKKSIALNIYSDPKIYPPTVNAANILSENGWLVYLIGIKYSKAPENIYINPNVKLKYIGSHSNGLNNLICYTRYCFYIWWLAATNKISIIFAYDAFAVFPSYLSAISTGKKWCYQQHDYFEFSSSFFQKIILLCENNLSKRASIVIFPQFQRAELFAVNNNFHEMPMIVFNGPRKRWVEELQPINKQLHGLRKQFSYLLVYQGGWSSYFGIDNLIKAISICKIDLAVVMLGKELETGIKKELEILALNNNVSDRFLFLEHIPYDILPSVTYYCDAGIAKLTNDKENAPLNDRFVIGASNKVTEYIACGLPVITCASEPNRLYFSEYPIGIMCDVEDAVKFANSIDELLTDKTKLIKLKENNRLLFLNTLNYDSQFSKIHDRLLQLITDKD